MIAEANAADGVARRKLDGARNEGAELQSGAGVDEARVAEAIDDAAEGGRAEGIERAPEVVHHGGGEIGGVEMRCGDGGHAPVADRRIGVAERAIADDLQIGRRGQARQVDRKPAESGTAGAGGPFDDDFEARTGIAEVDGGGADATEFAEEGTAGTGEAEVGDDRTVAGEDRLESPQDFREVGGRSDPVEVGIARAAARWCFEDRADHGERVAGVDHAIAVEVTGALCRGRGNGDGGESGADEADRES